jgi:hypothetical protein
MMAAMLAAACGEARSTVDSQGTPDGDGGAAQSTGGTVSTGGAVSAGGSASGDGGAGGSSSGGASTGGTVSIDAGVAPDATRDAPSECPDLPSCASCAYGFWDDPVGCPTCACAPPPLQLIVSGVSRPLEHLSLETDAWVYIGGIDRYVFDFTFRYDDPASDDEEEELLVGTRLQIVFERPVTEESVTYFYLGDSPLEGASGTFTAFGAAAVDVQVVVVSGFISVRQEGDRFVGGVHFELEPATGTVPNSIVASGPFDVPAPQY